MNNQELEKLAEALSGDIEAIAVAMKQAQSLPGSATNPAGGKSKNKDDRNQIVAKASVASGSSPIMIEVLYDSYVGKNHDAHTANKLSVAEVRSWLQSKNVKADNSAINLIVKTISECNYTKRPLIDVFDRLVEQMFDEIWSDQILNAITAQLEDCL